MTRALKKMPTPMGIGAGQTASVNLPIGLTYQRLYIRCNYNDGIIDVDVPVTDWGDVIEEIRLMVNGDAEITMDAADIAKLNNYYGQSMVAGALPLFLGRPWMLTAGGQDQTAYGTVGMQSFTLEMDIKAGAEINSLLVYANQSAATPWGPHIKVRKYSRTQGVTGEAEIDGIARGEYGMFAMHIGTAQIGGVEVLTNQRKVYDADKAIRDAHADVAGRVPQANMTHIDLVPENRITEALPMNVQDFRVALDFEATGSFPIYVEGIEGAMPS